MLSFATSHPIVNSPNRKLIDRQCYQMKTKPPATTGNHRHHPAPSAICYNYRVNRTKRQMAPTTYRTQIASDRRAAARERVTAAVACDNARIEAMYTDEYAWSRRARSLPRELVVYPELDFSRAARG
jgi:hypothetical protein